MRLPSLLSSCLGTPLAGPRQQPQQQPQQRQQPQQQRQQRQQQQEEQQETVQQPPQLRRPSATPATPPTHGCVRGAQTGDSQPGGDSEGEGFAAGSAPRPPRSPLASPPATPRAIEEHSPAPVDSALRASAGTASSGGSDRLSRPYLKLRDCVEQAAELIRLDREARACVLAAGHALSASSPSVCPALCDANRACASAATCAERCSNPGAATGRATGGVARVELGSSAATADLPSIDWRPNGQRPSAASVLDAAHASALDERSSAASTLNTPRALHRTASTLNSPRAFHRSTSTSSCDHNCPLERMRKVMSWLPPDCIITAAADGPASRRCMDKQFTHDVAMGRMLRVVQLMRVSGPPQT